MCDAENGKGCSQVIPQGEARRSPPKVIFQKNYCFNKTVVLCKHKAIALAGPWPTQAKYNDAQNKGVGGRNHW